MGRRRRLVTGALGAVFTGILLAGCGAGSSKIITPGSAPPTTVAPTTVAPTTATTHSCAYPPCM